MTSTESRHTQAFHPPHLEPLEARLLLDGTLQDIAAIGITKGTLYDAAGTATHEAEVTVDLVDYLGGDVHAESVRVLTPNRTWHSLSIDNDAAANRPWVGVGATSEYWSLELQSAQAADLDAFTQGAYLVQVTWPDGTFNNVRVNYAGENNAQLTAPQGIPNVTNFTNGRADCNTITTIDWGAADASEVDLIHLDVEDNDGNEVVSASLEPDATQQAVSLSDHGLYAGELVFADAYRTTLSSGIVVETAAYTGLDLSFGTLDASQAIPGALMQLAKDNGTGGSAVTDRVSASLQWDDYAQMSLELDAVELTTPDGTTVELEEVNHSVSADLADGVDLPEVGSQPAYDLWTYQSADVSPFADGTYTWKASLADDLWIEFDVPFADAQGSALAFPAEVPSGLSPQQGAINQGTSQAEGEQVALTFAQPSQLAIAGDNANNVTATVSLLSTGQQMINQRYDHSNMPVADPVSFNGLLADDLTYQYTVEYNRAVVGMTSTGIQYEVSKTQSASTQFSTGPYVSGGISGTVLDRESRRPLAGINVLVMRADVLVAQAVDDGGGDDFRWQQVGTATTGSDGTFTIQGLNPGDYRMMVEGESQANSWTYIGGLADELTVTSGQTTTGVTVLAHRAGSITGYVYDAATGDPAPNVSVTTVMGMLEEEGNEEHQHITAMTDANGRYTLYAPLTSRAVYPVAIGMGDSVTGAPYVPEIAEGLYPATADGTRGPDFQLEIGAVLQGKIVKDEDRDSDGQMDPVPGMMVFIPAVHMDGGELTWPGATTQQDGTWQIRGVPTDKEFYLQTMYEQVNLRGEVDVGGMASYYAWGSRWIDPADYLPVGVEPGTLTPGQTYNLGLMEVPQAGGVYGRVVDAHGNPVEDAGVEIVGITPEGGSIQAGDIDDEITRGDGRFGFYDIPAGRVLVSIKHDNTLPYTTPQPIHVVAGQNVDLGTIVVQRAQDGVTVWGEVDNYNEAAPKNRHGETLPYQMAPYGGFDRPSELEIIAYSADRQWSIEDMMWHESFLTGIAPVEDGFGDSLSIKTEPSVAPQPSDPDYTEAHNWRPGSFALSLPTGPQTVVAIREGYLNYGGFHAIIGDPYFVDGRPGQVIGDPTLNDRVGLHIPVGSATVSGELVLPDGHQGIHSQMGTMIILRDARGEGSMLGRAISTANAMGEFFMTDVPAGMYYIMAAVDGLATYISEPFSIAEGQSLTHDITFTRGAVASGTVTCDGAPVAHATIISEVTGKSVQTDANGQYELTGLTPGNDRLWFKRDNYVTEGTNVTLTTSGNTVDFDVSDDVATLTGSVQSAQFLTDGKDNDQDGTVDEAGEHLVGGAEVIAYHTTTHETHRTTTFGGTFAFDSLSPGEYIITARMDGMATTTYPAGQNTLTLAANANINLADQPEGYDDHIEMTYAQPRFRAIAQFDEASGVLSVTFKSDRALLAAPAVTLATGQGALSDLTTVDANEMQTFTCTYTAADGETSVSLTLSEDADHPLVSGNPRVRTFRFSADQDVRESNNALLSNADGAELGMNDQSDASRVYIPPFALSGNDAAQELVLEAVRIGNAGEALDNEHRSISGRYDFQFINDSNEVADVTLTQSVEVTLSFDPSGVDRDEFLNDLNVGYYDPAAEQWVWNDLANSNPASGISNIRVNWAQSTITFLTSHFTTFAGVMAGQESQTLTLGGDGNPAVVRYTDGTSGQAVLARFVGAGSATFVFSGDNLVLDDTGRVATLEGDSISVTSVDLASTTTASRLIFAGGVASVGEINGSTPMGMIHGRNLKLDGLLGGGINLTGTNGYTNRLVLGDVVNGADVSLAGNAPRAVLAIMGDVTGTSSLTFGSHLGLFRVASAAQGASVSAMLIDKIIALGDFGADVTLAAESGTTGYSLKTMLVLGSMPGVDITASGRVGVINARGWSGGSLSARDLTVLTMKGDLNADLTLNALDASDQRFVLNRAVVTGDVTDATWTVTGPVGTVVVTGTTNLWQLDASQSVHVVKLGDVTNATFDAENDVTVLMARSWTAGTVSAGSFHKVIVNGGSFGATLDADATFTSGTYGIRLLSVRNWLEGNVTSVNSIGTVIAGGIRGANVHAGVNASVDLPTAASDFTANAGIGRVIVRGMRSGAAQVDSFLDANIAASDLDIMSLSRVDTTNNSTPFGLATSSLLRAILWTDNGTRYVPSIIRNPSSTSTVADDLVIRIL